MHVEIRDLPIEKRLDKSRRSGNQMVLVILMAMVPVQKHREHHVSASQRMVAVLESVCGMALADVRNQDGEDFHAGCEVVDRVSGHFDNAFKRGCYFMVRKVHVG